MSGSALGDLIRALGALDVDDQEIGARIAKMLGVERAEQAPIAGATRPAPEREVATNAPPPKPVRRSPTSGPISDPARAAAAPIAPGALVPLAIRTTPSASTRPAYDWIAEPLARARSGAFDEPLDLEPLFAPLATRTIVAAALSTMRAEGSVQTDLLVDRLARRLPLDRAPRAPRRTLRAGAQVLVDRSDGMVPFARDAADLVARIRRVVGDGATSVLSFADDPRVAGVGSKLLWKEYAPPAAGTKVIALTDLGLGCPDEAASDPVESWLTLESTLRRAGCPLIGVVPYPASRWPTAIARAIPLIEWDRRTNVCAVLRALRSGRRRT